MTLQDLMCFLCEHVPSTGQDPPTAGVWKLPETPRPAGSLYGVLRPGRAVDVGTSTPACILQAEMLQAHRCVCVRVRVYVCVHMSVRSCVHACVGDTDGLLPPEQPGQ